MTIALVSVGLIVWVMCPGLQTTVLGWVEDVRDTWQARDARDRIEAEMASEVWHITRILEQGGDIAGPLGLAS